MTDTCLPLAGQVIRTTLPGMRVNVTIEVETAELKGAGVLVTGSRVQADDHKMGVSGRRCFYITRGFEVVG